jgi:PAS domain S-box-containing protein
VKSGIGNARFPQGTKPALGLFQFEEAGVARDTGNDSAPTQTPAFAAVRYRRFVELSRDLICILDHTGRILELSPSAEYLLQRSARSALGRNAKVFVARDQRHEIDAAVASARAGGGALSGILRHPKPGGGEVELQWSAVASAEDGLVYAIGRDVTEREQVRRTLETGMRLEAVGRLTGGVAHDFNNLLTVVLGSAELLQDEAPEHADLVRTIRIAAERGAELVDRLLSFARKQELQPVAVEAPALLTQLDDLLRRTLGEHIQLQVRAEEGVPPVLADPVRLEGALLNLAFNARDAMPAGGVLSIEALNERRADGDWVLFRVRDTGFGMAPDVVARAFEPFFTTKGKEQGTGLGLSMVHGFAHQSGGSVCLESAPGKGCCVCLRLPAATRIEATPEPAGAKAPPFAGGTRILVVEDDALLRFQLGRQLASLGYVPSVTADAREALQRLESGAEVDLLFADVVMPGGMDGHALCRAAVSLVPGLKCLLTSGYDEEATQTVRRSGWPLLRKPYRKAELHAALQTALSVSVS